MARPTKPCQVADCQLPHSARGYCGPHYSRWRRYGDPLAGEATKPCARPGCPSTVPLSWEFCKGRSCQGLRFALVGPYWARKHAEKLERLRPRRRLYLQRYRGAVEAARLGSPEYRAYRDRVITALKDRAEDVARANPELATLLAEQEKDARRRQGQSPWVLSLDAPYGDEKRTLGDSLAYGTSTAADQIAYHDPTFDSACASTDEAWDAEREEVWAWNLAHRQPPLPPIDETVLTRMPSAGNGLTHKLSPRHRGRVARAAAANGKRSSRSKSKVAA